MRQDNPAVPGSGLVSLSGTVALPKDPQNRFPASTPQFLRSQSMNLPLEYTTSSGGTASAPNTGDLFDGMNNGPEAENKRQSLFDLSTTPLSAKFQKLFERGKDERCPLCFRKFGLFVRTGQCEQCQRIICSSCLQEFVTNGVVYLCKDCLDIT
ncbi:unnamed protein product [Echinostoma caproni]|uniref:FYVE-type domain-containing protein n=1 Tax=Echinostoma caproni TaxID=27848 RepID=A0A183B7W9_9TREM|nr:unnamed protein product [Echinostoma caproni]